jgi:hypothetical protein
MFMRCHRHHSGFTFVCVFKCTCVSKDVCVYVCTVEPALFLRHLCTRQRQLAHIDALCHLPCVKWFAHTHTHTHIYVSSSECLLQSTQSNRCARSTQPMCMCVCLCSCVFHYLCLGPCVRLPLVHRTANARDQTRAAPAVAEEARVTGRERKVDLVLPKEKFQQEWERGVVGKEVLEGTPCPPTL